MTNIAPICRRELNNYFKRLKAGEFTPTDGSN